MKMNKFLLLAAAAFALTACSDSDDATGGVTPSGKGAVTIKVAAPAMTKAVTGQSAGSSVKVVPAAGSEVAITLTAATGGGTITLTPEEWTAGKEVTFYGVTSPTKVTVTMNDGKASYASDAPTTFTAAPENIPVYGETTTFTLTSNTGTPGTKPTYEHGGTDGEVYQLYTATVNLAIPVARIEVGGIKHETHANGDACGYATLNLAGAYLDHVYATGAGVTYANGAFPCATGDWTNYIYPGDKGGTAEGVAALWSDEIGSSFIAADAVFPADNQVYAYYFYGANGAANLPVFKLYFDQAAAAAGATPVVAPRYAMITSYKTADGTQIEKFEPGHIYQIIGATLTDENIIPDEENDEMIYGVEVTVVEATWQIDTVTADWAASGSSN